MLLWLKAFHIIGVVTWFAGLFYVWRLFVYHAESKSSEVRAQLTIMEAKLLKIIMRPASLFTLLFGVILLVHEWELISGKGWIWVKLVFVLALIFNHGLAEKYHRLLAKGREFKSSKFRTLNEMPTIILIVVVILAVVKPF